MYVCTQYFEGKGFDCEDVSSYESYDILATKGDKKLKVEVKGTRGLGDKIILTRNEVDLAKKNETQLFVVSKIKYNSKKKKAEGGNGKSLGWDFENRLTALSYSYQIND